MENKALSNDIVLAKFINYMKKALIHKKLNYLRDKEKIAKSECSFNELNDYADTTEIESTNILNVLNEKEIAIIKLHILEKKTYNEISKKFNLKPESIRKIQYRAIKKLKNRRYKNNED